MLQGGNSASEFVDKAGNPLGIAGITKLIVDFEKALGDNAKALNAVRAELDKTDIGRDGLRSFAATAELPDLAERSGAFQGPRGLLRGSAEAAAAEARFLNRTSASPEVRAAEKGNQLLTTIASEVTKLRRQVETSAQGID